MCDRCMENTRTRENGGYGEKICEPCDDCYNLVADAVNEHRDNLANLDRLLVAIAENPEPVGKDFEFQLLQLKVDVKTTLAEALISSKEDESKGTLRDRLSDLNEKLGDVMGLITDADQEIAKAKDHGTQAARDTSKAKRVVDRARESLKVRADLVLRA